MFSLRTSFGLLLALLSSYGLRAAIPEITNEKTDERQNAQPLAQPDDLRMVGRQMQGIHPMIQVQRENYLVARPIGIVGQGQERALVGRRR